MKQSAMLRTAASMACAAATAHCGGVVPELAISCPLAHAERAAIPIELPTASGRVARTPLNSNGLCSAELSVDTQCFPSYWLRMEPIDAKLLARAGESLPYLSTDSVARHDATPYETAAILLHGYRDGTAINRMLSCCSRLAK